MKILICGAGAIGSNLAANLAVDLKGKHEITVLDYDTVEERNITPGTQFYFKEQVGMFKTMALEYNIYKFFNRGIETIEKRLVDGYEANDVLLEGYDLIIDCFDNFSARHNVQVKWDFSKDGTIEVLHVGFSDKMTFAIEWAENYFVPDDITSGMDICEIEGAGSFVKMVAALASLAVQYYISKGGKKEFIGNSFKIREVA